MPELVRVISVSMGKVTQDSIITAFQEVDSIYMTSVVSDYKTPSNIFNRSAHSETTQQEKVVHLIIKHVVGLNLSLAMLQLNEIVDLALKDKGIKITPKLRSACYRKYVV